MLSFLLPFSRHWHGQQHLEINIGPPPSVVCLADTPWLKFDVYVNGTYTHMVLPQQLQFHANERIYTQGKVYDAQIDPKSNAVLLSIGADSLGQRVTIIKKNKYRTKFDHPEINLIGKTITVLGWVTFYKGEAAMKLNEPKDLQISTREH